MMCPAARWLRRAARLRRRWPLSLFALAVVRSDAFGRLDFVSAAGLVLTGLFLLVTANAAAVTRTGPDRDADPD